MRIPFYLQKIFLFDIYLPEFCKAKLGLLPRPGQDQNDSLVQCYKTWFFLRMPYPEAKKTHTEY